jgi:hypothetical protein
MTIDDPAVTSIESDPGHHAVGHELAAVIEVEDLGPDFLGGDIEERQRAG